MPTSPDPARNRRLRPRLELRHHVGNHIRNHIRFRMCGARWRLDHFGHDFGRPWHKQACSTLRTGPPLSGGGSFTRIAAVQYGQSNSIAIIGSAATPRSSTTRQIVLLDEDRLEKPGSTGAKSSVSTPPHAVDPAQLITDPHWFWSSGNVGDWSDSRFFLPGERRLRPVTAGFEQVREIQGRVRGDQHKRVATPVRHPSSLEKT
ncbi:MAG: hypothetical protein CM1200mP2_32810 [Planctomycetaceae bacterium]|nr:MAG: hypothetical protein CM1200mP2_32810 [Planctomycetaceae bacterium]